MAQCSGWIVYRWMINKFMTDYENTPKWDKNTKIIALECVMRISKRFHFDVDCANNLMKLDEKLLERTHGNDIQEISRDIKMKRHKVQK